MTTKAKTGREVMLVDCVMAVVRARAGVRVAAMAKTMGERMAGQWCKGMRGEFGVIMGC
jgi:hypothetical protein